ncbi:MAG: carboxypeptidase-like regulatory domain-containing protein, partial [Bacteroidales bacterium]|nr:carboxypeptidase-like regulatory domain-containing protein [Bacteroidales bacterium]
MKIKTAGMFIAFLFSISALFAQNQNRNSDAHITGHVVDKSTGEHIPFAAVAIKGTTMGTASDASGHFYIRNVPFGTHIISASFVGYDSQ